MIKLVENKKELKESLKGSYPKNVETALINISNKEGFQRLLWAISGVIDKESLKYTDKGEQFFKDNKKAFNDLEKLAELTYKIAYDYNNI